MEQKKSKELNWRLHTVMSSRGIRTATELHRRLEPYGIDITSHQLSRIVAKLPARLNTDVLAALMTELECSADELLQLNDAPAPNTHETPKSTSHQRTRKSSNMNTTPEKVLGPKLSLMPKGKSE